jgi:hypothetical protein
MLIRSITTPKYVNYIRAEEAVMSLRILPPVLERTHLELLVSPNDSAVLSAAG